MMEDLVYITSLVGMATITAILGVIVWYIFYKGIYSLKVLRMIWDRIYFKSGWIDKEDLQYTRSDSKFYATILLLLIIGIIIFSIAVTVTFFGVLV